MYFIWFAVQPATAIDKRLAESEFEAETIAVRVAECQSAGVKSKIFEVEMYPADFLRLDSVTEIMALDPGDTGNKVWDREKIEEEFLAPDNRPSVALLLIAA